MRMGLSCYAILSGADWLDGQAMASQPRSTYRSVLRDKIGRLPLRPSPAKIDHLANPKSPTWPMHRRPIQAILKTEAVRFVIVGVFSERGNRHEPEWFRVGG